MGRSLIFVSRSTQAQRSPMPELRLVVLQHRRNWRTAKRLPSDGDLLASRG